MNWQDIDEEVETLSELKENTAKNWQQLKEEAYNEVEAAARSCS